MKQINEHEELISKKLIKYPNEYIMQLRVDEFHKKIIELLSGLLQKMPFVMEFHIDFRNWHATFNMGTLKKTLDTKVSSRQEFSLIRKSLNMMGKVGGRG